MEFEPSSGPPRNSANNGYNNDPTQLCAIGATYQKALPWVANAAACDLPILMAKALPTNHKCNIRLARTRGNAALLHDVAWGGAH